MSSWFDEGRKLVINDAAQAAQITWEQAAEVYNSLDAAGLIDYDVEKEVFYAIVHGEEE